MKDISIMAAKLMAASMRTAPKAGGKDFLEITVAAKTAGILNIDNRVQQRVGAAARALGLIKADVVMRIPVGIYGKSIFYDRQKPAAK